MTKLPSLIKESDVIAESIYKTYEAKESSGQNERIGASDLGKECDRAVWYSYRWASVKSFGGRMLRLFKTGHLQEARIIEDLRAIGCTVIDVDPATGKQFKIVDGPIVMKPDGLIMGVPGAEKTQHALEVKTHSEKSFKGVQSKGVREAKPEHNIQMQLEAHYMKLKRVLYVALNKNTEEIYSERIDYNQKEAEQIIVRAKRIAALAAPPGRIREDPGFFKCKFCDHHSICHMDKVPEVNCRTCSHSESLENGTWMCWYWDVVLDYKQQQEGCEKHIFIPDLVPNSKAVDASPDENWVEYESDGVRWKNGEKFITSKEMNIENT